MGQEFGSALGSSSVILVWVTVSQPGIRSSEGLTGARWSVFRARLTCQVCQCWMLTGSMVPYHVDLSRGLLSGLTVRPLASPRVGGPRKRARRKPRVSDALALEVPPRSTQCARGRTTHGCEFPEAVVIGAILEAGYQSCFIVSLMKKLKLR